MSERGAAEPVPIPAALRRSIESDLHPVRPLAAPIVRVAWVVPIAILLLVSAAVVLGVRRDAVRLGWALTWGASALEMTLGLGLIAASLREAVPGTTLSRRALGLCFGSALVATVAITGLTWVVSPILIFRDPTLFIWRVCVAGTIVGAFPALAVSGALVARGLPLRPRLAGALYGLGSGLLSDAGWRIFCHFSDPAHVFGAHLLGVGITTLLGAAFASFLARPPLAARPLAARR
jgi:hypothetical protein